MKNMRTISAILRASACPQISVQKPRGFTGRFRTGHPAVADRPQRDVVVDDFLMDTRDVTVAESRSVAAVRGLYIETAPPSSG